MTTRRLIQTLFALGVIAIVSAPAFAQQKTRQRTKAPKTQATKAKGVEKLKPSAEVQEKLKVTPEVFALYEPFEYKGVPYRVMKPIDFDPAKTYPLILSLHGAGGRGKNNKGNVRNWNAVMADEELRRRHPCFVFAPQTDMRWQDPAKAPPTPSDEEIAALAEHWTKRMERMKTRTKPGDEAKGDTPVVLEILNSLKEQYKIDGDRIYVLGHSMGGAGTWTTIWENPDMFAAAIPCAGGLAPWYDYTRFKDVPIWAFHGAPDAVVPTEFSREIFAAMKKAKGNMKLTELPGTGHGANAFAFTFTGDDKEKGFITQTASDRCDKTNDVWDWLFAQKLSDRMKK